LFFYQFLDASLDDADLGSDFVRQLRVGNWLFFDPYAIAKSRTEHPKQQSRSQLRPGRLSIGRTGTYPEWAPVRPLHAEVNDRARACRAQALAVGLEFS
jgi:hypothetical protein